MYQRVSIAKHLSLNLTAQLWEELKARRLETGCNTCEFIRRCIRAVLDREKQADESRTHK